MLASACGEPTRDLRPRPPETRRVEAAPEVRAPASATVASVAMPRPPAAPPAWLDPDYDATTAPLRARIVRSPTLYGDERNLALNTTSGSYRVLVVPVFEEPKQRDSERVRVLCDSTRERVALFVARAELAQVTRRGAVLAAREDQLDIAQTDPSIARMVFDAGIELTAPRDARTPTVAARYGHARVSANGFMRTSQLDEVYEWPVAGADIQKNGKIPRDATFYDAPRGQRFALLVERPDKGFYDIETVGEPVDDHVFVHAKVEGGVLSGWIHQSMTAVGYGEGGGRLGSMHGVRSSSRTRVALPKGTLLSLGDEPIGVVKADGFYTCLGACDSRRPLVNMPACGDTVDLVAQLPKETK